MNIQKKVLLYCFITILVAIISTWFTHRIAQVYKPKTEVKGIQTKTSLPMPTRTLSLTPTPTKIPTFSVSSPTPTNTPTPIPNNTSNTTNNSSPTQSTDTTSTNPSPSDNNINVNSTLTDQSPSFPSPTSQQAAPTPTTEEQVTPTLAPITQPTNNQDATTVIRSNDPGVGNTVDVVSRPIATPDPLAVGTSSEVHACPENQTCQ